jgi:hypothetical protein
VTPATTYTLRVSWHTLCSGCSAGARGALFNAQHVLQRLVPTLPVDNVTSVTVLLDSAFWVDIAPLSPDVATPFQRQAALAFALYGANATVDPACLAVYRCAVSSQSPLSVVEPSCL